MEPLSQVAECIACRHVYAEADALRCKLFKCAAELPCARFEIDPAGTQMVWFSEAWDTK